MKPPLWPQDNNDIATLWNLAVYSTMPSVVLTTPEPSRAKISMPLCTPEVPQGSNQNDLAFQSDFEAPTTGIFILSGITKPLVTTAITIKISFFVFDMLDPQLRCQHLRRLIPSNCIELNADSVNRKFHFPKSHSYLRQLLTANGAL